MNYTENYHLPQWEETDRVLMEDFNRMCVDMEAGLKKNAQAAADAMATASSAPTSAAVKKAQSTADSALSKADAARAVADAAYCPSYQSYVVGSYIGVGQETELSIDLGFRPKFVIIGGQKISNHGYIENSALIGPGIFPDVFVFTDTGFTIKAQPAPSTFWAHINEWHVSYCYLAFR